MESNFCFTGVRVAGMSRTLHAPIGAHPAATIPATAATEAPRKRRDGAGTTAASVNRGSI